MFLQRKVKSERHSQIGEALFPEVSIPTALHAKGNRRDPPKPTEGHVPSHTLTLEPVVTSPGFFVLITPEESDKILGAALTRAGMSSQAILAVHGIQVQCPGQRRCCPADSAMVSVSGPSSDLFS